MSDNDPPSSDNSSNDPYPDDEYKFEFPCDHKQADHLLRKGNKHATKLIDILNDDWEKYRNNRRSALQHFIWHATFYTGKNPTVVWNILTETPLYEEFDGGYADIKQWVEEIPRDNYYAEGPDRSE